jgi:6-phosphofructokinase 2
MAEIVTVTLNPAIDLSASVGKVVPVRKLRCGPSRTDPGGGGINVARVLKRLGLDVEAVYPIGGFPGRALLEMIEREGVASRPIEIAGETREDMHITDESTGEQFRFVFPGPELSAIEWHRLLAAVETMLPPPRIVVGSGGLALGVPDDFFVRMAGICRQIGARFMLDTYGPALRRAIGHGLALVKPNQREFGELIGRPLEDPAEIGAEANSLVERGAAEAIVVTLGENGAVLATGDEAWYSPPIQVSVTSAVGAGDSFMGAMVGALARGKTVREAFRYGCAGGTSTLMRTGTELCMAEDVERLLAKIEIRPLIARRPAPSPARAAGS